ncbi:MAG: polysaccharide deacetylase family protein [Caldilineaceae bacterium]|nr:polysaccharide deacetylase family protein [Caldilineaceae bacterium]
MPEQVRNPGALVISLDFELFWGMFDVANLDRYRENILGARAMVPTLLDLFERRQIHATWATVGFLFFESRVQLLQHLPTIQPNYDNAAFSPYRHLETVGDGEEDDPFHYAPSLIAQLLACPHQEVATHTFSHYYCLERGQGVEAFREDLTAAIRTAEQWNVRLESLVFPRNQFNADYLSICRELGIRSYRGTEHSWIYQARSVQEEHLLRRGLRLTDAYLNLTAHNVYSWESMAQTVPFNIPSSRFLRPYSRKLQMLEPLRLRRIKNDLTFAAQHGLIYHLWWHPHNFGSDSDANLGFLRAILDHQVELRQRYGMLSLSMAETADRLEKIRG